MGNVVICKADVEDVERLIEIRRQFQETVKGTRGREFFARAVEGYLRKHLSMGTCVVWLGEDEGEIVSCAMLLLVEELPVLENSSGRVGFLQNRAGGSMKNGDLPLKRMKCNWIFHLTWMERKSVV